MSKKRKEAAVAELDDGAEIAEVAMAVPLAEARPEVYCRRHVDARLNHSQATTLQRIQLALDAKQARTADGRRVISPADALKWLLEEIGMKAE